MQRILFAFVLLSSSVAASGPSLAQDTKSDCASEIKKAEAMMPGQRDAGKSEMLKTELQIAREMQQKKDEQGCMMHTKKAMDQMNK